MTRSGSRVVVCAIVALAAVGCRRPPSPFAANTEIPLGHVRVQVARIEPGEEWNDPAARTAPEDRLYDVYVSVTGLPTIDDPRDRRDYISNFLERQVRLVDADGDQYRCESASPESLLALLHGRASAFSVDDRYWVLRFRTPEVSRDFTLLLKNPEVQEGQPALASVHLGMPGGAG